MSRPEGLPSDRELAALKRADPAAYERAIDQVEHSLYVNMLIEDMYAAERRRGRPSVRAVLMENGSVELLGSDGVSLRAVHAALMKPGCPIGGRKLKAPQRDDFERFLDASFRLPKPALPEQSGG